MFNWISFTWCDLHVGSDSILLFNISKRLKLDTTVSDNSWKICHILFSEVIKLGFFLKARDSDRDLGISKQSKEDHVSINLVRGGTECT